MVDNEIKGISFPFRIGGRGGVVMSGKTVTGQRHIHEGLIQLLGTTQWERVMNPIGVEPLDNLFNDLNETTKNIAIFKISEAIRMYEPRINVTSMDIIEEQLEDGSVAHVVNITYEEIETGQMENVNIPIM